MAATKDLSIQNRDELQESGPITPSQNRRVRFRERTLPAVFFGRRRPPLLMGGVPQNKQIEKYKSPKHFLATAVPKGLEGPRLAVIAPNGPYGIQKTLPSSPLQGRPLSPGPRDSPSLAPWSPRQAHRRGFWGERWVLPRGGL